MIQLHPRFAAHVSEHCLCRRISSAPWTFPIFRHAERIINNVFFTFSRNRLGPLGRSISPLSRAGIDAHVRKLVAGGSVTIEDDAGNKRNVILSNIGWRPVLAGVPAELPR